MTPGDAAYPCQPMDWHGNPQAFEHGLTKREAFAMAALQGLLANPGIFEDMTELVERASLAADLLIEELGTPP